MSFIDGVKGFVEASRVGGLIGQLSLIVRSKLDSNGDGHVDAKEVSDALPNSIKNQFGIGVILEAVPLAIQLVKLLQKALAKKPTV